MLLQDTGSGDSPFHVVGLLVILLYLIVKDVTIPLMKKRKEIKEQQDPIYALKIDLEKVQSSVVELDKEFDSTSKALDNKLDIILDELRDQKQAHDKSQETLNSLRERMASVEAMLKKGRR